MPITYWPQWDHKTILKHIAGPSSMLLAMEASDIFANVLELFVK
jgi:hypothetical protein